MLFFQKTCPKKTPIPHRPWIYLFPHGNISLHLIHSVSWFLKMRTFPNWKCFRGLWKLSLFRIDLFGVAHGWGHHNFCPWRHQQMYDQVWPWTLDQCGKRVKTYSQKVLGSNSYVCRSYRGKTGPPSWVGLNWTPT